MKLTEEALKKLYKRGTRYKHPILSTSITLIVWIFMIVGSVAIGSWQACLIPASFILWNICGIIFANNVICFLDVKDWRKGVVVLLLSGPREIIWATSEILYPTIVDAIKYRLDTIFTSWREESEDE